MDYYEADDLNEIILRSANIFKVEIDEGEARK